MPAKRPNANQDKTSALMAPIRKYLARRRAAEKTLRGRWRPYMGLIRPPYYDEVMGEFGERLYQALLSQDPKKAMREFRGAWDALRQDEPFQILLSIVKPRGRGRKRGSRTIDDGRAMAVALAIYWGGMTATDVLKFLGEIKADQTALNKELQRVAYLKKRGRSLWNLLSLTNSDIDEYFRTDDRRSPRAICAGILKTFRNPT
jgi:hypothetical protein